MKKDEIKINCSLSDVEQIYDQLSENGIMFFNYCKMNKKAATLENCFGSAIFLNERLLDTTAEEKYAILHEFAHLVTGTLHHVNESPYQIDCDEYRADKYVADRWVPIKVLRKLLNSDEDIGICEIAEYFNFPPRFIERVLQIYREEGLI